MVFLEQTVEGIEGTLLEQQELLHYYFKKLDLAAIGEVVSVCAKTSGLLILMGIGKSGLIAEKIAATLSSTGTRSLFLSPVNCLHGDLGFFSPEDTVLVFSSSGETAELLELMPRIRVKRSKIVAVVSSKNSSLARLADHVVFLPVKKELEPWALVPTISSLTQLLFGDLLVVNLIRAKGVQVELYAQNHPGGQISKRASLRVSDLMHVGSRLPLCLPSQPVISLLVELSQKGFGALIVVDEEGVLRGVFTDGDLRRMLQTSGSRALDDAISSWMTSSPIWVGPDLLACQALRIMQKGVQNDVTMLPVVNRGRVVGVLHMHDLVREGLTQDLF